MAKRPYEPPRVSAGTPMLCVGVTEEQIQALERLGKPLGYGTAEATLQYLIAGFTDGVRRPGSWERQAVYQFFGVDWVDVTQCTVCGELGGRHFVWCRCYRPPET